ncbi:MuF-like minor capsid protein [Streptomyces phage Galactica]|nr:MuF-like minor capsid protein [Streptomyces phage Galactica]
MAVSPDDAEDLGQEVAEAYAQAELGLIGRLAQFIGTGLGLDSWASDRRDGAGVVRRTLGRLLGGLFKKGRKAADKAAHEAERRGVAQADGELGALSDDLPPPSGVHAKRGAEKLGDDLSRVEDAMVSQSMQAYHRIITEVSALVEAGTTTRLKAAERALAKFAAAGITGFVDRAGRKWELATYVEMAVRTTTANIMVDAHADRIQSAGVRLVMVSDAPYECPKCKPWEGKILEIGGPSGKHEVTVRRVGGGGSITVMAHGSLAEARADGLFHPNCRHSITAYLPGVSRAPEKPDTKGVSYKDTQRLREIERTARKWDRERAAALTPEKRKAANAKYREWRKKAAEHAAKTGLPRKTNRERHDATR